MAIVSEGEADLYFATRLGASLYWASGTEKEAALETAETQLATRYALDSTVQAHKNAVCEQALFLLQQGQGADKRAGLQAMGVASAGMIQETYRDEVGIPICAYAQAALKDSPIAAARAHGGRTFDRTRDDNLD